MDFSTVETLSAQDEGRWMTILHPHTGEETDAQIRLSGIQSKLYRRLVFQYANKQAKSHKASPDAESSYKYSLKVLAECTLETRNLKWRGEDVTATDKARLIAFYEALPKIREQSDAFMAEDLNYAEAEIEKKSESGSIGVSA